MLRRGYATRRNQANLDQSPSAGERQKCREGRASGRVRVEGDQTTSGGVQRNCHCFVKAVSVSRAATRLASR
jgi:hypothetical protein